MRRWLRWIAVAVVGLLAIFGVALLVVDSDVGHRWVVDRIGAIRTANGLRFTIGRIDGSLYGRATLRDVRVYDRQGLFFVTPRADLDWSPLLWFRNRLEIAELHISQATLARLPRTTPTGRQGPLLPDFDIHIGRLAVDRLVVDKAVTGVARTGRINGRADIRAGRALVDLAAVVDGSDRLKLAIDAAPDKDRFDIDVIARGTADGVLARLSGFRKPIALDVSGDGSWAKWDGSAVAKVGGTQVAELLLGNRAGSYTLTGNLALATVTKGKVQRMSGQRILVNGNATFANRRLDGGVSLRSSALAIDTTGVVDLGSSAFRNLRIKARLLRPAALFPNMTARNMELRAILDGAFGTAKFDYRITADRFAFDQTGFEGARAAGHGRFSKAPVVVPVRFTARRVTGVGDVAGGILGNLSVDGVLRVTSKLVTGDDLKLSSDKLKGRISLVLDLATGRYQVGLNGALGRYLIPGLGVVDVTSTLRVVPGPGGHGTRVVGQGTAQMVRLDNAFFRSLAGGLPRIVTGLERTPDGILHFTNLVLTAPAIRLTGNGYRRRDGTFHFEGQGRQATYGPLTLKLDGKIDKPTLDLVFANPNAALGLSAVKAHLDPTADGFAFTANGGSRLGPFAGRGRILLPRGGQAAIAVDELVVSGTRAAGLLAIVDGGFAGTLKVAGGGIGGEIALQPVGGIQQIKVQLTAENAQLAGAWRVRRARVDATILLDPAGTTIDATASGVGLSRGKLRIGRFVGSAKLRSGVGEVRASISGQHGRAFDIQTVTQITADRYVVTGQGTVDRKPLKLLSPSVIQQDGDGWRLSPTKLSFAGGEATIGGHFSTAGSAIDATLARLPLSLLDIGYPGLGLGGAASGTLNYAWVGSGAPTGKVNLTIRGLSRSGLVLSSRPIDVGVAGLLTEQRAVVRAVMASGGATIGRAQAVLTPTAGGDLASRYANAGVFAQLRYKGPADTLWRLTGVELFDLSGPVAIGADVRGTVAAPAIRGVVRAQGARIESATTGTVLTNVRAGGQFVGSRLSIDSFAADAGKGGRVTGSGRFEFAAANGIGLDLQLQADHAVMIDRDDIGATVTGPIVIRSSGTGGVISGDVVLNRSRYRLGQATAATAVPKLNIREINLPGGGEEDDVPTTPWRLDLKARSPGNLAVTGLGLTSEWSADLQIGGQPDNPAITGRANLVRGDFEFAGREFELARGVIRFAGEVPANPALDIEANANVTGLNATIRVTGVAQKPEIAFTSVPALPQDELLSRLLFGTSITNLSAPEALQLAAAVAALQNGGNGLNPINAVRRAAGLDRLRILPADPQTGQGTSVAAGKYITRRFYAEIVTDGQGYSATQVEFQVTRWLSILSSISTLGRQSANIRVSKDY
ncbi:translocation/assembly module TamB domain-containing protein [Sphingomonas sp. EC-HK361]|uniref:translocation/assembly module TamB domain-containing protein n=1 Tax=Sphingomonas sp. EC-HK361 TaxID=2038397 RepID=UPI001F1E260F|nr:translocation/assembly module TamB [Sphingomonas sp. EC-HK361]